MTVDPVRSANMSRIRSTGTLPEIRVRKLLHNLGARFRLHRRDLPGTPDIVLPSRRVVVFVHGCFWHAHGCKIGRQPKSRLDYWLPKLERNRARHEVACERLHALGWRIEVIWECETKAVAALEERLKLLLQHYPKGISHQMSGKASATARNTGGGTAFPTT
jgi:DNA mismatch endonuclease (patch repair protein)